MRGAAMKHSAPRLHRLVSRGKSCGPPHVERVHVDGDAWPVLCSLGTHRAVFAQRAARADAGNVRDELRAAWCGGSRTRINKFADPRRVAALLRPLARPELTASSVAAASRFARKTRLPVMRIAALRARSPAAPLAGLPRPFVAPSEQLRSVEAAPATSFGGEIRPGSIGTSKMGPPARGAA